VLLDGIGAGHPLADAAAAFRALVLTSMGRPVDAVALLLATLAPHLPRYQRSVRNYAADLLEDGATR
jgi:hypothetical protein